MADESAVAAYLTACRDHGVKRPNPELLKFFREVEPIASEIHTIDLTNNYIGNRGIFALCDVIRSKLPRLKTLILRNQKLYNTDLSEDSVKGNAACDRVISTLQDHPSITAVDFSCNLISNYAGRKLLGLAQLNKHMCKILTDETRVDMALRQRINQQCEKNANALLQEQVGAGGADARAFAAASSASSSSSAANINRKNQEHSHRQQDFDELDSSFGKSVDPALLGQVPLGQQPVDLSHLGASTKHRAQIHSEGVDPEKVKNYVAPVIPKSEDEVDLIVGLLQYNVLFSHLGSKELRTCALAMSKVHFKKNDDIMHQGETNDSLFILQSGTCDILKEGQKVFLKTAGTAVGELELMYDAPCVATVRVSSDKGVVAWKLDRETYRNLVFGSAIRRRDEYKAALEKIPFLASLDQYERGQVADAMTACEYKPGEYIIRYNEEGEWMHLILEGTIEVVGRDDFGEPIDVCDFHEGDYIGELEFLNKHRTVADCKAKTFVRTAKINRRHFEMCLGSLKDLLQRNTHHPKYEYYNRLLQRTNSNPNMSLPHHHNNNDNTNDRKNGDDDYE